MSHTICLELRSHTKPNQRRTPREHTRNHKTTQTTTQEANWYVSNISIIFDCSMLLYLLFWTILGFIFHFYIIFGTNLLTGGPAQNCCFFAYFSISRKQNIKRSPNGMKPSGTWSSHRTWSRRLGPYSKKFPGRSRGWRARPPWARPLPRGPLGAPPTCSFLLYIPT